MAASSDEVSQVTFQSSCSFLINALNEMIEKIEQVVRQQEAQREEYYRHIYLPTMQELGRQELVINGILKMLIVCGNLRKQIYFRLLPSSTIII